MHLLKTKHAQSYQQSCKEIFDICSSLAIKSIQQIEINCPSCQKQPPDLFYKKGIFKTFSKFLGKHLS